VNKASGVRLHRERLRVPVERTAMVGDSLSDAQMAGEVGTGFIVGPHGETMDLGTERPDNLRLIPEPVGLGFAEVVRILLAG
jgi:phosphoserine phosphatase